MIDGFEKTLCGIQKVSRDQEDVDHKARRQHILIKKTSNRHAWTQLKKDYIREATQ